MAILKWIQFTQIIKAAVFFLLFQSSSPLNYFKSRHPCGSFPFVLRMLENVLYLRVRAKGIAKQPAQCEKKCRARRVTLMKNKYRFGPECRGIFQQTRIYIKSVVRRKVFRIHARSIYKDTYFLRGRKKPGRGWACSKLKRVTSAARFQARA